MTKMLLTAAFIAATVSFANAQGSPAAAPGESPAAAQNQSTTPSNGLRTAPVAMPQGTAPQGATKQGPETGSAKDNASAPAR